MQKTLTVGGVLFLVLASLTAVSYAHHIPPAIPAPDFTLTDIDGNTFTLSSIYAQHRVLINFFNTY